MEWVQRMKAVAAHTFDLVTWPIKNHVGTKNYVQLAQMGYHFNSIASACIIMIASTMPAAKLKVYRMIDEAEEEYPDHWLSQLIERPNGFLSTFELWEWTATYLNVGGVSYWELVRENNSIAGEVKEVYPIRPDRIEPVVDSKNLISHYIHRPEGGGEKRLEVYQVLRIPYPDPLDPVNGLSPLSRVARELGIDNKASDFVKSFFDNGAVLAGLLSTEQKLTPTEADSYERRWWQKFGFGGGGGVFKTPVLGQGVKYEQMALNFKDMEFESVRSMTETRICGAFGVDPVLLPSWVGIKHGNTRANFQEARRHLWEETLIPLLRRIEDKINSQLLWAEEGVFCRFDLSEIEALKENVNDKWKRVTEAWRFGLLKRNAALQELGFDEDPDGDVLVFDLQVPMFQQQGNPSNEENNQPNGQQPQKQLQSKAVDLSEENLASFVDRMREAQEQAEKRFAEDMKSFF